MKNTKYLCNQNRHIPGAISASQIMSMMGCEMKWKYNYVDELSPRIDRPCLTIGKLCHKGMECAMEYKWSHETVNNTVADNEQCIQAGITGMHSEFDTYMNSYEFLDEEIPGQTDIFYNAINVFITAWGNFHHEDYKVYSIVKDGVECPAVELHFKIPCPGSKGLHGFIDVILLDKETNQLWSVDYKFRKQLLPDNEEQFNIQNAIYTIACYKMNIPIVGTITWQHSSIPPQTPSINKNGTISRSKIRCTWDSYANFCVEHGQDPALYEDEMKLKLSDIEWFRLTKEFRNRIMINRVWNNIIVPYSWKIKRLKNPKNDTHRAMYPWGCKMCSYQSLCQAELRGYDVEFIKDTAYRRHDDNTVKNIIDDDNPDVI